LAEVVEVQALAAQLLTDYRGAVAAAEAAAVLQIQALPEQELNRLSHLRLAVAPEDGDILEDLILTLLRTQEQAVAELVKQGLTGEPVELHPADKDV